MVLGPVRLGGATGAGAARPELEALAERAARVSRSSAAQGPDLDAALDLARDLGGRLPRPGHGSTLALWEALATVGAVDLGVARVVEPHLDAVAILDEAGLGEAVAPQSTWGVFAAEGGAGRLEARETDGAWRVCGPKPWCSLADRLTHGLVTAWVDEDRRGLFAVDLRHRGVRLDSGGGWVSRGLSAVRSTGIRLEEVPATAVGEPGWYLERPGFAYGGIGVAAVWYGGAVGLARRLRAGSQQRQPDQLALAHLGAVDAALAGARAVLGAAAREIDGVQAGEPMSRQEAWLLFWRSRQVVADAAELVLARVAHALGPAPLALEEEHARRVADLTVYLRQHHAERDAAALGRAVLDASGPATGLEGSAW